MNDRLSFGYPLDTNVEEAAHYGAENKSNENHWMKI
jgi:hypothetical protein